jgi:hypothetical protein
MKKIMTLALGLSLLTGSAMFAQDQPAAKTKTSKTQKAPNAKKSAKSKKGSSGTTTTPAPK